MLYHLSPINVRITSFMEPCHMFYMDMSCTVYDIKSADPASPWPRQGGAWDHRRCGTLLSLKATVNCTTASDLLWASKTDGCIAPPSNPSGALATASVLLCGSKLTDAPCPALKHCLWLLWGFQNWRMHNDRFVRWFAGISAGALSGFMVFQNWRMAPCPDLNASPTPKSSLDWAAAGFSMVSAGTLSGFIGPLSGFMRFQNWRMAPVPISNPPPRPRAPWIELRRGLAWFRLAPSLVLWDFGWPPVWFYWPPVWFYGASILTDGPLSRSQSFPHAQELLGLGCGGL